MFCPVFAEDRDPPQVELGEKLFRETRFSQFYFANAGGNPNKKLSKGDSVTELTITPHGPVQNPYRGNGINCASCHLVSETKKGQDGNRSYTEFVQRSSIPLREGDPGRYTVRNSPTMVDTSFARKNGLLLHYDGEFASEEGLVRGTLTGRNFGWLPGEGKIALAHIANVIRNEKSEYPKAFQSQDLPKDFQMDVKTASDSEILDAVAKLIGAYMKSLVFARNEQGENIGSPYDQFLEKNHLPRKPRGEELPIQYAFRLARKLNNLDKPQWVDRLDGKLELHEQEFAFGEKELKGLKIFLRNGIVERTHAGNCFWCHTPPNFTDFSFRNTGTSQEEYDSIHGEGAFAKIYIPSFAERIGKENEYLPASENHPRASGKFKSIPDISRPGYADLGAWNVLGNPDIPDPQKSLIGQLCESFGSDIQGDCNAENLLPKAIGVFKMPTLRDLGHSEPYLHNGSKDSLEKVMSFYAKFSEKARKKEVRNHDLFMKTIFIDSEDQDALVAFLKSLNEDYE